MAQLEEENKHLTFMNSIRHLDEDQVCGVVGFYFEISFCWVVIICCSLSSEGSDWVSEYDCVLQTERNGAVNNEQSIDQTQQTRQTMEELGFGPEDEEEMNASEYRRSGTCRCRLGTGTIVKSQR